MGTECDICGAPCSEGDGICDNCVDDECDYDDEPWFSDEDEEGGKST